MMLSIAPRLLLPLIVAVLLGGPALGKASDTGFWVAREIRQGITEQEFFAFAERNGLEVKSPLPGDAVTKSITIDGTDYWLTFCANKLTYVSWNLKNNSEIIKSINQRLNIEGFKPATLNASSVYNDREKSDLNQLSIKLVNSEKRYSVSYSIFDENGQIALEDTGYDDSYGCEGDPDGQGL